MPPAHTSAATATSPARTRGGWRPNRRTLLGVGLGTGLATAASGVFAPPARAVQPYFRQLTGTPWLRAPSEIFLRTDPALHSVDYVGAMDTTHPDGIPRFQLNGQWCIHPTVLGNFLNSLVASYENLGDRAQLTRVATMLHALMARATPVGDARLLPYDFTWSHLGPSDLPPWYSSFGQSKFPILAHRLHRLTGERIFQQYEDQTFAAFDVPARGQTPWVAAVVDNYLWLDEYPLGQTVSKVFNGHVYATLELLKYAALSGRTRAWELARGALITAHEYRNRCRRPGYFSRYYADRDDAPVSYHGINTQCYWYCFGATGHESFGITVNQMLNDWVTDTRAGTVRVLGGQPQLVRRSGSTTEQPWTSPTSLTIASRTRTSFQNRGPWSYLDSGPRAGYWIRETPSAFRLGLDVEEWRWRSPRRVWVEPGATPIGYRIQADGTRTAVKTGSFTARSSASSSKRALLAGRPHLFITNGRYEGLWVEESAKVHY